MADQLTLNPNRPLDWAGDVVPGAKATFYASGTTTPLTVYQDAAGTIPHTQPILADSNGVLPPVYRSVSAKVIITDADDVALPGYPLDPVPRNLTDISGASLIPFEATEDIPEVNVQDAIERVQANLEGTIGTSAGMLAMDAAGAVVRRTITGTANQITVTNGNGAAGSPTIAAAVPTQAEAEAGTDTNKLMTAQRTEQHMLANALGWGQTWQDVLATRAINTSYQNTTGRPIMVCLRPNDFGSGALQVSTDGTTWVSVASSGSVEQIMLSAIVPATHFYRMTNVTIGTWVELR